MANIQHASIPEAQLHEAKGASTSTTGQVLTSTGGAATFQTPSTAPAAGTVSQGIYDYNDLGTTASPIPLTVAGTWYKLTNDGAGAFTNKTYALAGLADIWDVATGQFNWNNGTLLSLGDTVDIRVDVDIITTGANKAVEVDIELGIGGSPYKLPIIPLENFKTAGTYHDVRLMSIYLGDTNTLNFPAQIEATADGTGVTVVVNGWYIRPLHTNT